MHKSDIDIVWKVDIIDEIIDDIDNIAKFIEEVTKEVYYGERFGDIADNVIDSLKNTPYIHNRFDDDFDNHIRRIDIPGYNASILYKTYDNTLEVIAVMAFHTLRDPEEYRRIINERVKISDAKISSVCEAD